MDFSFQRCHRQSRSTRGFYGWKTIHLGEQSPDPTYEKLNHVLMDTEWESKFPMVSVRALPRIEALSDHAPILLTTGLPRPQHRRKFKFELGWLLRDGFHDMVKEVWEKPVAGPTPIHRWNNKMRALRKFLGGWARHTVGILKKEKLHIHLSLMN